MYNRDQLAKKANAARRKQSAIGPDINLSEFDDAPSQHSYLAEEDLCSLPMADQNQLLMAGLDVREEERGGTYLQKDTDVIHCHAQQEGVEVIPIKKALETEPWIGDYYWKLIDVDTDKYTAAAELGLHDGYVIRALPGSRSISERMAPIC